MDKKLDIERSVNDAIQRAESDDKRDFRVEGSITGEQLRAEATAELGKGWSLAAIFRRLRRSKQNEFGFGVNKEF